MRQAPYHWATFAATYPWLAWNSSMTSYLSLPNTGVTSLYYHAWLVFFSFGLSIVNVFKFKKCPWGFNFLCNLICYLWHQTQKLSLHIKIIKILIVIIQHKGLSFNIGEHNIFSLWLGALLEVGCIHVERHLYKRCMCYGVYIFPLMISHLS
jgi:hypothetical protein